MNGLFLNNLKSPSQIFEDEGLLFFPGLFSGDQLTRLRNSAECVLERYMANVDENSPKLRAVSMRHLEDPFWHPDVQDHRLLIMETVADPRCTGIVEQVFEATSLFRTTSLFFNPRTGKWPGGWHRDLQFILQDEEKVKARIGKEPAAGIQLQIALIDNDDIEYVPFSAMRYDSPEENYIRCSDKGSHSGEEGMPGAMRIAMRAGDAIIFNPDGLHRGRYYSDNPRRTFMLTYTPRNRPMEDKFSYHPWLLDEKLLDGLSPRARVYFEDFIGVYRDYWRSNDFPSTFR